MSKKPPSWSAPPALIAILIALISLRPIWADSPATAPAPATTQSTTAPEQSLTPDQLQAKIAAVTNDKTLSDADRTIALGLLQSAVTALQQIQADTKQAAAYQDVIDNGPAQIKAIRQKIQAATQTAPATTATATATAPATATTTATAPATSTSPATQSAGLSSAALQQQIAAQMAAKNALAATSSDLDKQLTALRENTVADELAAAKRQQDQLSEIPVPGEAPALADARHTLGQVSQLAAATHVHMLQLKQASAAARQALLTAQRDLTTSQTTAANARLTLLYTQLVAARHFEAQQGEAQAQRTKQELAGQPQVLRDAADKSADLSKQLSDIVDRMDLAVSQIRATTTQLQQITQSFDITQQELQIQGLGADMAEVLRGERRRLPGAEQFRRQSADVRKRINQARLERLQLDQEKQNLDDIDAYTAQLLLANPPPAAQRDQVESKLRQLLGDRHDLAEKLDDLYTRYLNILTEMDQRQQKLEQQSTAFATLLDERLVWIPSATPISRDWLDKIGISFRWIADPDSWLTVTHDLLDGALAVPQWALLILLICIVLLVRRPRMAARLDALATQTAVPTDGFRITALAVCVTVLMVLPGPLLLWFCGWLLLQTSDPSEFVRNVGDGMLTVAWFWVIMEFLRQLCRPHGVVDSHFHWSRSTRIVLHKNLTWLFFPLLPLAFLVATSDASGNEDYSNGLGRAAFVIQSLALSVFLLRILNPRSGAMASIVAGRHDRWPWKTRFIWYPVASVIPFLLGVSALCGYYYAASALQTRLFYSLLLFVGAILVHNITSRWILLLQQKLAAREAQEKHDAELTAKASRQAAGAAGEGAPKMLEVHQIDLLTINEHTAALLNAFLLVIIAAGLWLIWIDLLPALRILDTVVLWHHSVTTAAGNQIKAITLSNLALAIILAILTFIATRNFTGFLEIALLHRLSLDPGVRYAINRIVSYLIVAVGTIAAFSALGIDWSQVQWLAAAFTVGLGFGLQEIFANFVSGLIVLFERPLRVGDIITVNDLTGTVSRIRMRATTITDWDNREIIVPNKLFITNQLINWTLSDSVTRLVIKVSVAEGSDIALVERLMLEAARAHSLVAKNPAATVFFVNFSAASLDFELRVFVSEPASRNPVINDLHIALDQTFREHKIEIR